MDTRNKDFGWRVITDDNCYMQEKHYQRALLATLMDVRDELKALNAIFHCHNALEIPDILRSIRQNTRKPVRRKVKRTKKTA